MNTTYRLVIFVCLIFAGCQHGGTKVESDEATHASTRKILFYRCPMDPQVTSKDPKTKCTVCGMKLGPVYEEQYGGTDAADGKNTLKLSAATASIIGIETAAVKKGILKRTLRVAGVIVDDETKHRVLSARVPGRIEKLYVNQVGIDVGQNQPLAEIYSPDVLTAQRLYLENYRIIKTGTKAISESEFSSSREKLLAFGLEEPDIKTLEETGKPKERLEILAPFDGTVVSRQVFEGQYVNENDKLFEIGDFSTLWFIFDAYEQDLPLLRMNQTVDVTLTSLPNETESAPIMFIDPNLNEMTRTARVRVVLPNPKRRILNRQTANGLVHIEKNDVLFLPRSALLYTRSKPVVYVALGQGKYQLRQVEVGCVGDDNVEIVSGVNEAENVVVQAALMIDSQSQLMNAGVHLDEQAPATQKTAVLNDTSLLAVQSAFSESFIVAVENITSALSADDLAEYHKHLPSVQEQFKTLPEDIQNALKPFADKLAAGKTLKEVRTPFEPFSNALADIVRSQPKKKRQAFIFQCPMSPVLGTARWIQAKNSECLNPFFGSEMLNCGAEIK